MENLATVTTTSAPFTDDKLPTLRKLLLNSWSAEFALQSQATPERTWNFPQSYYAVLFGAKAFLLAKGMSIGSENGVHLAMSVQAAQGLYGLKYNYNNHPLVELANYRIQAGVPAPMTVPAEDPKNLHDRLLTLTEQAAYVHEKAIYDLIGQRFYAAMLDTMPVFLVDTMLSSRAKTIREKQG